MVILHNSIYSTQYGHLRGYARGIKRGMYVKQGQVIGYVGMSGVATGPHLDFRIKKYGKPVNFLRLEFPSAKSVSRENMDIFKGELEEARTYLKYLESDFFDGRIADIKDYIKSRGSENLDLSEKRLQK